MAKVTCKVIEWVDKVAKDLGWSETEACGGEILLKRTDLMSVHRDE